MSTSYIKALMNDQAENYDGPVNPNLFCKIFEFENYQVLVRKINDPEEEEENSQIIEYSTLLDGIDFTMKMKGFFTDFDKTFQCVNVDHAEEFYSIAKGILAE